MSKSSKINKDIKEEKKQVKKIKKEKKDYLLLRKKAITIGIICLSIVVIELIVMLIMHLVRESKITYIDALYHIENVDNSYYIASGSSNFKHSRYNNTFLYEYTSEEDKNNVQKIYAEKAKLVKLDKELNVVFESTFKSDYDSCFYDVSKVEDGFIAVGSYIYDKKQIGLKTRDGLIVKYDFDGKVLWSKNYQVLGDTEFKDILVVEDGFIVVGQSIYENMEIGNHPDGGGIIVKYDFEGNILWKNNFGGNKSGIFESIVKVSDGYIAGGKDAANYGMLVKFDLEGNRLWVKNYANTDTFGFTDLKIKDDKLYIASSYNVSDLKDEKDNIIYKYDPCIFIYDLNGELLDKITLTGNSDDRFNSLVLLDDKIVTVGYTKSSDFPIDNLKYKKDMAESFIIEFDYNGKVIKKAVYGGSKNDILSQVILAIPDTANEINKTNDYIAVGYSNSRHGLFKGNGKDYFAKVLRYSDELELLIEK